VPGEFLPDALSQTSLQTMTPRGGMTLVEVLIATFLLVVGLGALLFGMHYVMIHAAYVRQAQVAMNAAQGQLERLAAQDFDALMADAGYCTGTCASTRTVQQSSLPGGLLAIQIRPAPLDDTTPAFLDIHVAACWQARGRAIGEANGATQCADGTADGAANWWVDSPVVVSTRVARRE
jgi:type II secretory pathway pseudopilin PulG